MNTGKEYYFTLAVFEQRYNDKPRGVYDIYVRWGYHAFRNIDAPRNMRCVYMNKYSTRFNKRPCQLTKYMRWKFEHFQYSDKQNRKSPLSRSGKITQIHHDLDWIISVINVEVDYVLGPRKCLLEENSPYLKEYLSSRFAGYGPKYCDVKNPKNNISNSLLTRIFG